MYTLTTALSKAKYLLKLKQTFRSPFLFFDERVCGFVLGNFFAVTYHSPYEWNRRITAECNRAWGYVREDNGLTTVRFIRGKGLLSPFWLVLFTALIYLLLLWSFGHHPAFPLVALAISLVICLVTAFESIITEAGEAGFHEVTRLLLHPEDYYG